MVALETYVWYGILFRKSGSISQFANAYFDRLPSAEKVAITDQAIARCYLLYGNLPARFELSLASTYAAFNEEVSRFCNLEKVNVVMVERLKSGRSDVFDAVVLGCYV